MPVSEIVLAGEGDLTQIGPYREAGGYASLEKARGLEPSAVAGRDPRRERARPRRRRLPDGQEGELPREGHRQADVPRRQRGRVGAGDVQGPRDHVPRPAPADRGLPDHGARDRLDERLHLHPRRVPGRVRDPARGARPGARGGPARRRHGRAPPRRRCVHLRRGDRAARVARGEARAAALEAAVPGRSGPVRVAVADQQRGDDRDRAVDRRARRRGLREDRRRELRRHARVLAQRQRRQRRELRAAARDDAARADLRHRRRHPRRPRAEGDHPRRLVGAGADRRPGRHAARLRLDGRAEDVPRLRRGDRDRRPLLHGAARPARRAVLHARVVRQVHAVPRGHALDGADPREDRERARRARRSSTCSSRSATGSSASVSARSATQPRCPSRATSTSSAASSGGTSTKAAARSTSRRSSTSSPPSTSTRTRNVPA